MKPINCLHSQQREAKSIIIFAYTISHRILRISYPNTKLVS